MHDAIPSGAPATAHRARFDISTLLSEVGPFVALLVASVATAGSLFFSEVWGWLPCSLCWYQRILMYPLVPVLAVGILRRDHALHQYALPLAVPGMLLALYHYLLIKTDLFPPPPCRDGIPCDVDYLNLFGFINIPLLALVAFALVSIAVVLQTLAPAPFAEQLDSDDAVIEETASVRGIAWLENGVLRASAVAAVVLGVAGTFLWFANAEMQRVQAMQVWLGWWC